MGLARHLPRALAVGALVASGNARAQPAPSPGEVSEAGSSESGEPARPSGETLSVRELEARALFTLGVQMAEAERWSEAEKSFARADALVPRASTAFNRALALYRLGRIREMLAELDRFLERSDPMADTRDRGHAQSLKQSGETTLATLLIRVAPPGARVRVDGEVVLTPAAGTETRFRVDPGDHIVTADHQGFEPSQVGVSVSASEQRPVWVTLEATPPPPPSRETPVTRDSETPSSNPGPPLGALVMTLTGAATLIAAGVTGVMALDLDARIGEGCSASNSCFEDLEDDQARMETLALTSSWLSVTGVVLAGTGVTWWLLASDRDAAPGVSAWVSPVSAGVKGRF